MEQVNKDNEQTSCDVKQSLELVTLERQNQGWLSLEILLILIRMTAPQKFLRKKCAQRLLINPFGCWGMPCIH